MANEVQAALEQITKEFNELKAAMSGGDLTKYSKDIEDVGRSLRSASRDATVASSAFSALQMKLVQSGGAATAFTQQFKGVGDTLVKSAESISSNFGQIATEIVGIGLAARGLIKVPGAFDQIGRSASDASYQVSDVTSQMNRLANLLPNQVASAVEGFGNALEFGGSARNFENAMLQAVAAGGNMGDMIGMVGNDLAGLDRQMSQWVTQTQKIADVTGMSTGQVLRYSQDLAKIPEAMREGVQVGTNTVRTFGELESIIRTAHGSFQDINDVFKDVQFSLVTLGSSTQEALEMTARMAAVGQSLKLPMETMRQFAHQAAEAFKFLGDNTQGAISVMAGMGPALRESGLGPAAVQEIVSGFTKGVSDMDIAQKAFVSAQTGGAAGLQGAFEIDLALREGNLDEVASKVQSTLEGMIGGPLVTLEEAAASQTAAAQMTKQIQFLTTGPLKVAQNEQQAIALVEAMARQQRGEIGGEGAPSPAEALENAMQRGETREERQIDFLQMLSNEATAQTILLGQIVDQRRRQFLGPRGVGGQILRQEIVRQETEIRENATRGGPIIARPQTDTYGQMRSGGLRITEMAREMARGMGDMITSITVPTTDELGQQREARQQSRNYSGAPPRPAREVGSVIPQTVTEIDTEGVNATGAAPENLRTVTIKLTNDKNEVVQIVDAQINAKTGMIVNQAVRAVNKKINDNMQGG